MATKIYFSKVVYKKFLKAIEHFKKQDDLDRQESPRLIPLEWDPSIKNSIRKLCQEDRRRYSEEFAEELLEHATGLGLLIKSPYGGHMFPLPPNSDPLPTREEFVADIKQRLDDLNA